MKTARLINSVTDLIDAALIRASKTAAVTMLNATLKIIQHAVDVIQAIRAMPR